jgi:hypothetical protein
MKFVVYKYRENQRGKSKNQNINIEKMLFLSVIIVFILMLLVQAALTNPTVRTFLNGHSTSEGIPLEQEEYLFSQGQIELKLLSENANENLKVLLNGDEITAFSQDTILLTVKNGDIVEIDGSDTPGGNEVEIVSKSDNVITDCQGKKLSVDKDVKQLVKLRVEGK